MGQVNNKRLMVLICSCQGYSDRIVRVANAERCRTKRQACRETWLANRPAGVQYAFFVGGSGIPDEPDVWTLDAPDTYHGLPEKVKAAFTRAMKDERWNWLFKCDDDTYVHLPRLIAMVDTLQPTPCVISWPGNSKDTAHGGAGYLLPRAMVQAIVDDPLYNADGVDHEDKQVTYSVRRAGGARIGDSRFHASMDQVPTPQNDQITCHHVSPDDMQRIHAPWYRPSGIVQQALPQSRRQLPKIGRHASNRAPSLKGLPDGLLLPKGTERIIIFSNVPRLDITALRLKPGDHCIHLNRARHFDRARGIPGLTHALVIRAQAGHNHERQWFDPISTRGAMQIIHVMDGPMASRRPWWQQYCRDNPGKGPTTGFIAWHLATEANPRIPVVLAGFAPGEPFGSPLYKGHAWNYERDAYKAAGVCILRPLLPPGEGERT